MYNNHLPVQIVPLNLGSNKSIHTMIEPSVSQKSETVILREKLNEIKNPRNRLSDSILIQQKAQMQPMLNASNNNQSHLKSVQYSVNSRSFRFHPSPLALETIHQRANIDDNHDNAQKLFIVRHSERVDSTFGANWIDQVFDKTTGAYRRINLNLPKKMVRRKDVKDFLFDPPITELGLHQCRTVGEELAAQSIKIDHVYSSPALRCVQTADQILEGLGMRDRIPIRIEPCLFEFLKWYPVLPVKWPFLDLDEFSQNGFFIDKTYKPTYPIESLRQDEDELMYYTRSHLITKNILKTHQKDSGNILIVGHVIFIDRYQPRRFSFSIFLIRFRFRRRLSKFVHDN